MTSSEARSLPPGGSWPVAKIYNVIYSFPGWYYDGKKWLEAEGPVRAQVKTTPFERGKHDKP